MTLIWRRDCSSSCKHLVIIPGDNFVNRAEHGHQHFGLRFDAKFGPGMGSGQLRPSSRHLLAQTHRELRESASWDAATAVDSFKLLDKSKNMLDGWWHGLVGVRRRESAPRCGTRVGTVLSPRMRQHAPEEHPRPSPRFAARFGRDLRSWMRQKTARQLVELKLLHPYPCLLKGSDHFECDTMPTSTDLHRTPSPPLLLARLQDLMRPVHVAFLLLQKATSEISRTSQSKS